MQTNITEKAYETLTRLCGVKNNMSGRLAAIYKFKTPVVDEANAYPYVVIDNAAPNFAAGEFNAYRSLAEILIDWSEI